jgi:altronate dehydratase
MFSKREKIAEENAKSVGKHVTIEQTKHADNVNDRAQDANEHAQDANEHAKEEITHEKIQQKASTKGSDALKQVSCGRTGKKRKRSRQFKNVPLEERKRIKAQCLQLLSTL